MTTAKRPLVILSAAMALFTVLAMTPQDAEARHRHRHWRVRAGVGAVIAGAVIAEMVGATVDAHVVLPPVSVHVQSYPAPPPPQPYCCYAPPPPPVVYAPAPPPPAPVVYAPAPPPRRDDAPQVGLALFGSVQAGSADVMAVGGVAAALQFRTSGHSLLGLELQSLGAHSPSDQTRRSDLAALLSGRVFFWNAPLAPYFELAGGLGRTSLDIDGWQARASQLLGRFGVGIELRLGRHLVLDGQIAQLHRLRMDDDEDSYLAAGALVGRPFDQHERATEFRGGVGIRF